MVVSDVIFAWAGISYDDDDFNKAHRRSLG